MRKIKELQLSLGEVPIEKIRFNPKSRDDIPAVLIGLQYIYVNPKTREELFSLLEKEFLAEVNFDVGRPGMDIWRVVVLGVLKQGLGCDYDRLHELANNHSSLRRMLGHSDYSGEYEYELQTIMDNVSLLEPEMLSKIGEIVVRSGHEVSKKKPGEGLRGRCDSFPVKTDVEYPTDVRLLWDAVRSVVKAVGSAARRKGLSGWRQEDHLLGKGKKLFTAASTSRRRRKAGDEGVKEYLRFSEDMVKRAEKTVLELVKVKASRWCIDNINQWLRHSRRQIDQVERRLVKGEAIPQGEKVFSVFEEHTRWIAKGKAGVPVELGVPVCVIEDQHQFILNHRVMWREEDVDVAVPFIEETIEKYPELLACSFDRGFWSPGNKSRLDGMLESSVLPKKGGKSKADREREESEEFVKGRRRHPAVESAINALNHKGLGRVRDHGVRGFARCVALSVLSANVHRLGKLVMKKEEEGRRRKLKSGFLAAA